MFFETEVKRAIERIRIFPEAYPLISDNTRRCLISRFPYGIIYHTKEDSILIIAIMHLHRNPTAWKERIESLKN